MQVVDLLVAMCRSALESSRKSIIFDPYPSVVDPFDPKALAFNPKVQDFIWCTFYLDSRHDRFIIRYKITKWIDFIVWHPIIMFCFCFPFCWQKRSYDRLQKALDSIMSIREITQVRKKNTFDYNFDYGTWYTLVCKKNHQHCHILIGFICRD